MSSNSRDEILAHALDLIRAGQTVSLESAARAVGLTKPGLMYHFPTKEALMLGLVDAVAEDWLDTMRSRLSRPVDASMAGERVRVYLEVCLEHRPDPADMVMLADPRLREPLVARWTELLSVWFSGIDALRPELQAPLAAVRYMADGIWFANATGVNVPPHDSRTALLAVANDLLSEVNE